MEGYHLLLVSMASVTAVAGTVALLIYRGLEESGKTFMTKMRLQTDKTYREFRALTYAHAIQALGLLILGTGMFIGFRETGILIGRTATIIQGTITITVMAKWWRRF
ncbi:MAG: hypothetical protein BRC30_01535 [Nanohaloarchaea archaeon SW_7_46_7]|nr:MAG: hypothetical protein BRC30_01535 [Nanohaloarchaea archaeon SW_7_46_7]